MSAADMQNAIRIRTTPDDRRLLAELQLETGLNTSALIRLAIRRLHAQEVKAPQK